MGSISFSKPSTSRDQDQQLQNTLPSLNHTLATFY